MGLGKVIRYVLWRRSPAGRVVYQAADTRFRAQDGRPERVARPRVPDGPLRPYRTRAERTRAARPR
jgi:hypothetical protein